MSFGPSTQRFTFYVRSSLPTPERRWTETVHADEACARYRGSKATIIETSALGDTLILAARDCAHNLVNTARLCPRCVLPPR